MTPLLLRVLVVTYLDALCLVSHLGTDSNGDSMFSLTEPSETKSSRLTNLYEEAYDIEPRLRSLQYLAPLRHCKREENIVTIPGDRRRSKIPGSRRRRSKIPSGVKKVSLYLYELYLKNYSSASIKDIAETIQIDYLSPWLRYLLLLGLILRFEADSCVIRQFIYNQVKNRTPRYNRRAD